VLLILVAILGALGTLLGAFATYFTWREQHTDRGKQSVIDTVDNRLHPYDLRLIPLEQGMSHSPADTEAAITRALQPVVIKMTDLGTKMDVLWELQLQAAKDAARILHHPEEGRREIDTLLDAFIEDALTPDDEVKLRKFLITIRDWEPGEDVGFPVYQGEQMAAAAILRTMKHMPQTPPDDN
jgi:hypothetical protein